MRLTVRFYVATTCIVLFMCAGYVWQPLFRVGQLTLLALLAAWLADCLRLYGRRAITAERHCAERFSNGDPNEVTLHITSGYGMTLQAEVIDEIPFVFQKRDVSFTLTLTPHSEQDLRYTLRPTKRGVYGFGRIRVYVRTRLGLMERGYACGEPKDVKVYPSFLMLRSYELLAVSNNLTELGIKRIRRAGQRTEFEQIRDYVKDDDYRLINWNASARRHQLMVNVYEDERSQQIFSLIDKGRVMQQAFRGLTLLDYAINASLVLSYVAMRKDDKAGLVTFAERVETFLPASKHEGQLNKLLASLYAEQTTFGETDFSSLCVHVAKRVNQRSLLVVYTNFANLTSMKRQLPYLQQLSQHHRVLVVFFEDEELKQYTAKPSEDVEDTFRHVVAEKFMYEKRLIVRTLRQYGIFALLSTPENLSVDVINKYLEMKARQLF